VKCGLVLASRHITFYEIPIFGLEDMPQKQNSFVVGAAGQPNELFIF
jgi:hypothetical protein